jgi:cytochrome o ubiquinol oxidase subunit II
MRTKTGDACRLRGNAGSGSDNHSWRRLRSRALVLVGACALLASCSEGVLNPQGPIGRSEQIILSDATAIMLAVVVPVIVLTLAFAWWFRAGNPRARYRADWEYSGRIELIIWSIPALVILFLGGIAWIGSHELDPPRPLASQHAPVEVEVIALDWRWLFIYPEYGVASLNRLIVPAGIPIHFRLTSTSVMNSFFIPQLGRRTHPGPTKACLRSSAATDSRICASRCLPHLHRTFSGGSSRRARPEVYSTGRDTPSCLSQRTRGTP